MYHENEVISLSGEDMDFLFFFLGVGAVAAALTYIKRSTPNPSHE